MGKEIGKVPYEKVLKIISTEEEDCETWEEDFLQFVKGDAFNVLGITFRITYENLFGDFFEKDRDLETIINSIYEVFYFEKIAILDP